MAVYKELEFNKFLKTIEQGQVGHWQEIAEAIGVDADTITKWKATPEAIKAKQVGIDYALKQMEMAGKKDWRMWQEKLKMLGINPPQKVDARINDPRKGILDKYLGDDSKDDNTRRLP